MNMRRLCPLLLAFTGLASSAIAAENGTMSAIKEAARAQANAKMAEKFNLPTAAPAGAKVYIISPAKDATVTSPVTVVFGLSGLGVAPAGTQVANTGHHHLLIDDPTVDLTVPLPTSEQVVHFGAGQTEASVKLKPGKHTLQLVFGDWKHQAFNPTLASEKITITVK
ncbi:MAG: hypothetical protein K0Q76_2452 [Panacagrimonas sp.]|jgi:hypothetical protein|nr:DUF4399 domain-containing protein [Panacagrimonas sp.]MCC2657344.1 hypothetical protein [Panacagrimonas sp.]